MQASYLGVEIGGTKLQIVLGDEKGVIHERARFNVDLEQGAEGIRRRIAGHWEEIRRIQHPAAIGVGFGGPVDWQSGRICCSHHVQGWSEFPLGEWLHGLTGLPVAVDNDANVAALGEAAHGVGLRRDPLFYVTLGSGVGGGLVARQSIYHGAVPGESEIGHVRLDRSGATIESRCSGWAVDRKIRQLKKTQPNCLLAKLVGSKEGGEARHLGQALGERDVLAEGILSETADDLAFGLSHVVHLFHPALIVIGGGLALLGEPLRLAVAQALPRFIMEAFRPGPEVVLAALREDSVPVGALALAALESTKAKA